MGLSLTEKSLEERLSDSSESTFIDLVRCLQYRNTSNKKDPPYKSPYYKHELIHRIVHYFEKKGMPFGDSYRNAKKYLRGINKEPLKAIEKGMRKKDISDPGIPDDFIERLDDFEKIYFFAGINALDGKLGTQPDIVTMDSYELTSTYIRAGINHMAYLHNSIRETNRRKRRVTRGPRIETYKHKWGPPHAKKIKEKLLRPKDIKQRITQRDEELSSQFGELFSQEGEYGAIESNLFTMGETQKKAKLEEVNERISQKLDALRYPELALLTRRYGSERLGRYAVR